jgi:hypothetical protein
MSERERNVRTGTFQCSITTGGAVPGIKQATLSTLISGVGVNVPVSVSSLPPTPAGINMTVNTSGGGPASSPGQAGQNINQTIVLSKGPSGGVTLGGGGGSQNPPGSPSNNNLSSGQAIIGAGTALQIVNMNNLNTVRATSVNVGGAVGGSPQVIAAGPAGAKSLGPRMIISSPLLNNRPGQTVSLLLIIIYEYIYILKKS